MILVMYITIEEETMDQNRREKIGKVVDFVKREPVVTGFLVVIALLIIFLLLGVANILTCHRAHAQTRLTTSQGWPVVMDGGEWDQMGSTFRLGVMTVWKLGDRWNAGLELQAVTPFTTPHPNPQLIASIALKVSDKFSLGAGLGYMLVCPYGDKPVRQFLGIAIGPSFPISKNITFAFMSGPGATFTNGPPIWTWTFLPKFTFLLPF